MENMVSSLFREIEISGTGEDHCRWDDSVYGQGVMGRTIRTGKYQIHKVEGNLFFAAWEALLTLNGLRSVEAFSLTHCGEMFGALGFFVTPVCTGRQYDNEVFISSSIGISIYPNDGQDIETLVKHADTALYFAKKRGRSNYQFFSKPLLTEDLE